MKQLLFIIIALCCLSSYAQDSNVKIIDLTVIQKLTETSNEADGQILKVEFKIKNVENADKAFVLFGTTEEGSEILQAEASFTQSGDTYNLEYNNEIHQVKGYSAEVFISLTETLYSSYQHLTLYVLDKDGNTTQKLKLEK